MAWSKEKYWSIETALEDTQVMDLTCKNLKLGILNAVCQITKGNNAKVI